MVAFRTHNLVVIGNYYRGRCKAMYFRNCSGGAILTTLLLLAGVNFCWLRCDLSRLSNLTAGMKPDDGLDG
jgi:hypothetical protein